jgi:hypothetical protein
MARQQGDSSGSLIVLDSNERRFSVREHPPGNSPSSVVAPFAGEVLGDCHADNRQPVGETDHGASSSFFTADPWLFHFHCESPVLDLAVATDLTSALARDDDPPGCEFMP